jgi:ribosomal protein S27AE
MKQPVKANILQFPSRECPRCSGPIVAITREDVKDLGLKRCTKCGYWEMPQKLYDIYLMHSILHTNELPKDLRTKKAQNDKITEKTPITPIRAFGK